MKKIFLVSVSGGKDSQASWLYIREKYSDAYIQPYSADTGWEHDLTYEHIEYLSEKLSPIEVIRSDKYSGFEDMCIKRKGFPTRVGRFCTQELKIKPAEKYIKSWKDRGYKVICVNGIRAKESDSRSGQGLWQTVFMGDFPRGYKYKGIQKPPSKRSIQKYYNKANTVIVYQPVVYWTAAEVLDYNEEQGTLNNPLYLQGFSRVGCMPCIMARKYEIGSLSITQVDRIRELEKAVAKVSNKLDGNKPTFFQDKSKDSNKLEGIDYHHNKHIVNPLGLELGCISHYGRCDG